MDSMTDGDKFPARSTAAVTELAAPEPKTSAAFDYNGMDDKTRDTLLVAERLIYEARGKFIQKMADAVDIAHEALCVGVVKSFDNSKHGNRGEDTFRAWCAYMGISKSTAYNLLQVKQLLSGASTEETANLEAASRFGLFWVVSGLGQNPKH